MVDFVAAGAVKPTPGMVLCIPGELPRYLRLTHVFGNCVYAMWIGEPEQVRQARRPIRRLFSELISLERAGAVWGRVPLPPAISEPPETESDAGQDLEVAWQQIEPLIKKFSDESNLDRRSFSCLIAERAEEMGNTETTLRRLVIRFYYFGGSKLALLNFPPGRKPGAAGYPAESFSPTSENLASATLPKRRGRQSSLADEYGRNDFIVSEDDINDMRAALRNQRSRGDGSICCAHEEYLASAFRLRHPVEYAQYIQGARSEPVTLRQFRYYTIETVLPKQSSDATGTYTASLQASGPAEITEIDATVGRLFLVDREPPYICIGKPTLYLAIDRWSRFVVSVYLSLKPASYEELRYLLLISFTSRESRFAALKVDVDDTRWPVGRLSASICIDRGSELRCDSALQAIVHDLRIELDELPPLCPDGKAIVERFIRTLKKRMKDSRMPGAYADRPLDPQTREAFKAAHAAALYALEEAYRELIEIVEDHNNRPHRTLKRYAELVEAKVPFTPKAAYLWGLTHKTGLRSPPFTDEDYYRMLLATDKATISGGILEYRNLPYRPDDEAALQIAQSAKTRRRSISIRVDKTFPFKVRVPTSQHEWACFTMTPGAQAEMHGQTLDEIDARSEIAAKLNANAEHEARLSRVRRLAGKSGRAVNRASTSSEENPSARDARDRETERMKSMLNGDNTNKTPDALPAERSRKRSWEAVEDEETMKSLAAIRDQRNAE